MRSNYRKIGDFIQLVDERNRDLKVDRLVGLSITKEFIPSVANTTGTDMSKYKIVRKGQFACSVMQVRRDKKMPVALMTEFEEAIISQAYPVFEVKDESELLPEYLMMWFSRSEFDRHACFLAVGGVRGSLDWEDFLEMELPIPSIEKQRAIVAEYNTVVNSIQLNEQLNQKLEETAQAIYKQWFVDFEFPNKEGKPYKSSGGKMVYNDELDKEIPEGWEVNRVDDLCRVINGRAYKQEEFFESGTPIIRIQNLNGGGRYVYSDLELEEDKYVSRNDLIFAWSATFGPFIWRGPKSIYHYHIWKLECLKEEYKFLLFHYFVLETRRVSGQGSGSIFAHITKALMEEQLVLTPSEEILKKFDLYSRDLDSGVENCLTENQILEGLRDIILSKMTKVEETTEKEMKIG